MNLFWVLPILRHRNTIIVCPNCQSKLFCKMGLHQLKYATPDELDRSLTADAGGLVIILFLLSLVFLMCPLVNLIPALFIPIVNRHSSRANRIAGYVPIALAIAYNTWFIWSFIKAGSDNSP